jgi:hypothetical protein
MVYETYAPLYPEIFTKVNNAKDKPKKVAVLRKYDSPNLRAFLMCAFNPDIEWLLPEGQVPYIENDAPEGTEHSVLSVELKTIHNYVKRKVFGSQDEWAVGNPALNDQKRENMFIQLLEGLSAGEAQLLILAKDRQLHRKYKGLNANTVRDAFGWDEDFHDSKLVAERGPAPTPRRMDLGRTPADISENQRFG